MENRNPFADLEHDLGPTEAEYNAAVQQADRDDQKRADDDSVRQTETWMERSARLYKQRAAYHKGEITRIRNLGKCRALFTIAHPAEYAWMQAHERSFDFARSMCNALNEFGHLTEKQLAAVQRCLARDTAPRAEPIATSNVAGHGFAKLQAAFARASKVIKHPALEIHMLGDLVRFKPAKDNSKNKGYIYVNVNSFYMGKIAPNGGFFPSRDCVDKSHLLITEIAKDPLAAAVASGHATGRCAVCSRHLDNPESVERGIGPVCYNRMFGD